MKYIILFLCTISLYAKTFTLDMVDINSSNGYVVYNKGTKEKVSGTLITYYDDNKSIKDELPLKNGMINGVYRAYYKNGYLQAQVDYLNSKRDGKHISFYENGTKSYEADMKDEKKSGRVRGWHKNGKLNYDVKYVDNKLEGVVKVYSDDGKVESVEEYKNGELFKQIQPKKPDNVKLQTRALTTYGEGKDIYYLFISLACPHCQKFLEEIEKFKKDVTFYVYVIPLNPKNETERKMLDIVYATKFPKTKMEAIFDVKNNKTDLTQKISSRDTFYNNLEIMKAQQMQVVMGVRKVPAIIDTKGYKLSVDEFVKKYKTAK